MNPTVSHRMDWAIRTQIEWAIELLVSNGFEETRLHAELLLAHALGCDRNDLHPGIDRVLTGEEISRFQSLVGRRLTHEPLQYILGESSFMGMSFRVDPRVLIPRPETELLVEHLLARIESEQRHNVRILDIGTGSGNIAISLARLNTRCSVVGIDSSPEALTVARENVQRLGVGDRVTLAEIDVRGEGYRLLGRYHVIVSNPPYISRTEFNLLPPEVRDFEPVVATTDGGDGMAFFRRIAGIGPLLLFDGGFVFVEIAYDQGASVPEIFTEYGYTDVETRKDYGGNDRIVIARWKS